MKLFVVVLATLLADSNAKLKLRANEQQLLSAEHSAILNSHIEHHLRHNLGMGLDTSYTWAAPTLVADDKKYGTCVKAGVKVELSMEKNLQGETKDTESKKVNIDLELGVSFVDPQNKAQVQPFLSIQVTLLPFAQMFSKAFGILQKAMVTAGIVGADKVDSFKKLADLVKGKTAKIQKGFPALTKFLEQIANNVDLGPPEGTTTSWKFKIDSKPTYPNRPSIAFKWMPTTQKLTMLCAMIPGAGGTPFGMKTGTCGSNTGVNFQGGLTGVDFGAAFMKWLVPDGLNAATYKKAPTDKVPDCTKLKDAIKKNFADSKKTPGLFKKFLEVVGAAIKAANVEFMAELRFASIVSVKVKKKMTVGKLIGTAEKGTSK